MAETRIGLDIGPAETRAIAFDGRARVLGRARARDAAAALAALAAHEPQQVMVDAGAQLAGALERRELARVAVVRIGAPLTAAVPPLATWPAALRGAVCGGTLIVAGGAEYDGRVAPLDEDALARFLDRAGAAAVAITGVFGTLAPEQELRAADVARRTLGPDAAISLSHELGTIGLIERENATVLNAALGAPFDGLAALLARALPAAEAYVARGDGTLLTLPHARRLPVTALGSSWASALAGAARLSGLDDALVAFGDGAGVRVGALRDGRARAARYPPAVAGVPVGLRLADVRAVGDVAPGSVVVAVAGARLPENLEVLNPGDADFARGVGAAWAAVGGAAECVLPAGGHAALDAAGETAAARAIQLGADPRTVAVVDIEKTPIFEGLQPVTLIRVRAAGRP